MTIDRVSDDQVQCTHYTLCWKPNGTREHPDTEFVTMYENWVHKQYGLCWHVGTKPRVGLRGPITWGIYVYQDPSARMVEFKLLFGEVVDITMDDVRWA